MSAGPTPTLNYFAATPARRARFVAWVVSVTLLFAGTVLWIDQIHADRVLRNDEFLIGGWAALGALVALIAALLKTAPLDAIRVGPRISHWIVLAAATIIQLVAVALAVPALSEDVIRYRLDGRMWLDGVSPYSSTPGNYLATVRGDPIDRLVTHRELQTIYPPTAQLFFVLARAVENRLLSPPPLPLYPGDWRSYASALSPEHGMVFLRLVSVVCAVAATAVLFSTLGLRGRSPWFAVLLVWNPLFVIETGGMGHVDILGVLFVLLTIRALQSNRPILAAAMLALAAGVKPPAVLLAPFLFRDAAAAGSRVRARWLAVAFIGFLALVYSPMLYQQGYKGWLTTSRIYATSWEANGSIYELVKSTADETDGWSVQRAKDRARMLAAAAVVVTLLLAWHFRADLATAGYWIYLIALLFAPVVYPWYLLWVLCFVPLLRGWQGMTGLVWCATAGVSYLLWRTSDWVLPARWALVEYVPVYVTLAFEIALLVRDRMNRTPLELTASDDSRAAVAS